MASCADLRRCSPMDLDTCLTVPRILLYCTATKEVADARNGNEYLQGLCEQPLELENEK